LVAVAQDQPCHRAGGLGIQARQDVAVGVHGDGDAGVPEPLRDDLGRDAGGQGGRGVAVAHVVQPDPRETGRQGELLEPYGDPLWVDGSAVRPGEHEAGVLPARPHGQALFGLAGAVLAQGRHRGRIEGQRPAALGRLGLRDVDLVVDHDPGPPRRHAAGLQVDVGPAKPGDLTAPHAGGGEQQPGGVEPVLAGVVEEGTELGRTPDTHLRRRGLGQVG
jgi:hypothetical protein